MWFGWFTIELFARFQQLFQSVPLCFILKYLITCGLAYFTLIIGAICFGVTQTQQTTHFRFALVSQVVGCEVLSVEAPVFFLHYLEAFRYIFATNRIEVYFWVAVKIRNQGWLMAGVESVDRWNLNSIER